MRQDLQKLDSEKVRLEGKVSDLTEEKRKLLASLESVENDLKLAREEVEKTK